MDAATERSWSAKALRCFACEAKAAKFRQMTEGGGQTTGLYVIAELPRNGDH